MQIVHIFALVSRRGGRQGGGGTKISASSGAQQKKKKDSQQRETTDLCFFLFLKKKTTPVPTVWFYQAELCRTFLQSGKTTKQQNQNLKNLPPWLRGQRHLLAKATQHPSTECRKYQQRFSVLHNSPHCTVKDRRYRRRVAWLAGNKIKIVDNRVGKDERESRCVCVCVGGPTAFRWRFDSAPTAFPAPDGTSDNWIHQHFVTLSERATPDLQSSFTV